MPKASSLITPFQESDLSSERFEVILSSISDGVFGVDKNWNITCFNRAAAEIIHIPCKQAFGRPCHEVLRTNICREACALRYTIETGQPIINLAVYVLNSKD